MNKVNGYCQIVLPDRINVNELTSTYVTLTKAEARPIIDNLGLGGIKLPEDERTHDPIYKMLIDALVRKPAYIVIKETATDGIVVAPAVITDMIDGADIININAIVDKNSSPIYIAINVDLTTILEPETIPTIYDVEIVIQTFSITTTRIS